jgi:putative addiction module CopG family antidote
MAESLEQFVQHQLQSGKYQSYEEIVQAGLKLLQEHEEELDRVADALRPALHDYLHGDRGEEVDIDESMEMLGVMPPPAPPRPQGPCPDTSA